MSYLYQEKVVLLFSQENFQLLKKTNPLCNFEKRQTKINKGGMAVEKKARVFWSKFTSQLELYFTKPSMN
jgi:hypothetical protein